MIKAILFDFGGVIAEEGFREGLMEIGRKNGYDPDMFFRKSTDLVYESGYVYGRADESAYWKAIRSEFSIKGSDEELREELLKRFVVRPEVIEIIKELKRPGMGIYILSDQTNWLDELESKYHFFELFDEVFNSYHMQRTKRDRSLFSDICNELGIPAKEALFVDDNPANTERAENAGLQTITYISSQDLRYSLQKYIKD